MMFEFTNSTMYVGVLTDLTPNDDKANGDFYWAVDYTSSGGMFPTSRYTYSVGTDYVKFSPSVATTQPQYSSTYSYGVAFIDTAKTYGFLYMSSEYTSSGKKYGYAYTYPTGTFLKVTDYTNKGQKQ